MLDALTLVIYLPAWIVAVGALIARRWWLAAAAVVLIAAQVAFTAPELSAASPLPAWADGPRRYGCSTLTWTKASFPDRLRTDYERDHPDLITLEEFTPRRCRVWSRRAYWRTSPTGAPHRPTARPASLLPQGCA